MTRLSGRGSLLAWIAGKEGLVHFIDDDDRPPKRVAIAAGSSLDIAAGYSRIFRKTPSAAA
ncbi:MAG: hypothetical protein ACE5FL_15530 [Myxococcota bacterium]